jgi:hypothetical protein
MKLDRNQVGVRNFAKELFLLSSAHKIGRLTSEG